MKTAFFFLVLSTFLLLPIFTDIHPKVNEIQSYIDKNPFGPRLSTMLENISDESMTYNKQGSRACGKDDLSGALSLFMKAVESDRDNSFAWYNAAAVNVLTEGDIKFTVSALEEAVNLDWIWGLFLLVDPDFDIVRIIPGSYIEGSSFTVRGPEYSCTYYHEFYSGGVVKIVEDDSSADASGLPVEHKLRVAGTGYYCFIGDSIFEFFPKVDSTDIWYRPVDYFRQYTDELNSRKYDVFAVPMPGDWIGR